MFGRITFGLRLLKWWRRLMSEVQTADDGGFKWGINLKKAGKGFVADALKVAGIALAGLILDPASWQRWLDGNVPPGVLLALLPFIGMFTESGRNFLKHKLGWPLVLLLALSLPAAAQDTPAVTYPLLVNYTNVSPEVVNSTIDDTFPLGRRGERTTYYDGCNWTTCDGDFCTSTLRYCGAAWSLWESTLEIEPGGPPPAAKPLARAEPSYGLWVTKSVTIPSEGGWSAKDDHFGGRIHLRIPLANAGKLAIIGRGDVVSLPGANPFKDFGSTKAVEGYGGLEYLFAKVGKFDVGAAAVAGQTIPFDSAPTVERPEKESLAAGGLVAHDHKSGAWVVLLVGQYDAAGEGTRMIGSAHFPIKAGFSFLADYVSGSGGWFRPGVAYRVTW